MKNILIAAGGFIVGTLFGFLLMMDLDLREVSWPRLELGGVIQAYVRERREREVQKYLKSLPCTPPPGAYCI